ncbi:MAG: twin transmembrane helix small protein [Alphaproteobacteria bacterium]|nr:twin transmembrane helix small protein [Alphaproteobacteria bacterium]
MSTPLLIIVGILLVAIVAVLVMGVVGMARSGGTNPRRSNKLMQLRVILQATVLLILFLILALGK